MLLSPQMTCLSLPSNMHKISSWASDLFSNGYWPSLGSQHVVFEVGYCLCYFLAHTASGPHFSSCVTL